MKPFILSCVPFFFFSITACGSDSSSGTNPGDACDAICAKTVECALGPTLEECRANCLLTAPNMLEDYIENELECMKTASCEQLAADENLCTDAAKVYCTTDTAVYNRTACLKILECDGVENPTESQIEQCIQRQHGDGDLIGCFEPRKVDATVSCIEDAPSCTPSPVSTCVYDNLGLELGSSSLH